jgi:hypothetical protein
MESQHHSFYIQPSGLDSNPSNQNYIINNSPPSISPLLTSSPTINGNTSTTTSTTTTSAAAAAAAAVCHLASLANVYASSNSPNPATNVAMSSANYNQSGQQNFYNHQNSYGNRSNNSNSSNLLNNIQNTTSNLSYLASSTSPSANQYNNPNYYGQVYDYNNHHQTYNNYSSNNGNSNIWWNKLQNGTTTTAFNNNNHSTFKTTLNTPNQFYSGDPNGLTNQYNNLLKNLQSKSTSSSPNSSTSSTSSLMNENHLTNNNYHFLNASGLPLTPATTTEDSTQFHPNNTYSKSNIDKSIKSSSKDHFSLPILMNQGKIKFISFLSNQRISHRNS